MIGYGEPTPVGMSKNNMTARLMVDSIAEPTKGFYGFLAGTNRQIAHVETSTISSVIGGGIGSPCCLRLAR